MATKKKAAAATAPAEKKDKAETAKYLTKDFLHFVLKQS